MQAQPYWVERFFQDSKTICSMSDYQARLAQPAPSYGIGLNGDAIYDGAAAFIQRIASLEFYQ
jgi:hypothetical protein